MPRAVEIRVDPESKGVVIDTNFPNREVKGATWEPQLFRLGWDGEKEIWIAMQDAVPTLFCPRVSLRDSYESDASVLIQADDGTDALIERGLRQYPELRQTGAEVRKNFEDVTESLLAEAFRRRMS